MGLDISSDFEDVVDFLKSSGTLTSQGTSSPLQKVMVKSVSQRTVNNSNGLVLQGDQIVRYPQDNSNRKPTVGSTVLVNEFDPLIVYQVDNLHRTDTWRAFCRTIVIDDLDLRTDGVLKHRDDAVDRDLSPVSNWTNVRTGIKHAIYRGSLKVDRTANEKRNLDLRMLVLDREQSDFDINEYVPNRCFTSDGTDYLIDTVTYDQTYKWALVSIQNFKGTEIDG